MILFFQDPAATIRNSIGHCGMSETQEKHTRFTGKCFVPENDITISNISESLLSLAKPRFFLIMNHFRLTRGGQIVERSLINEEATQELWIVNRGPDDFSRLRFLLSKYKVNPLYAMSNKVPSTFDRVSSHTLPGLWLPTELPPALSLLCPHHPIPEL